MKPCGHPAHPEDGNLGLVKLGDKPRADRAGDVEAHRTDPEWFVGKSVKLGVPTPVGDNEYMWFLVEKLEGAELVGSLRNHPIKCQNIAWGDQVAFTADEIIDVYEA